MSNSYIPAVSYSTHNGLYEQNYYNMNHVSSFYDDTGMNMDMGSYPEDNKHLDWFQYNDDETNTVSSISPTCQNTPVTSRSTHSTFSDRCKHSKGKVKESNPTEAEHRLKRRREQNRESQQKFREKNRKALEDVAQALQVEKQTTTRLKAELTVMQSVVVNLQIEKQSAMEALQRAYPGDAQYSRKGTR